MISSIQPLFFKFYFTKHIIIKGKYVLFYYKEIFVNRNYCKEIFLEYNLNANITYSLSMVQ